VGRKRPTSRPRAARQVSVGGGGNEKNCRLVLSPSSWYIQSTVATCCRTHPVAAAIRINHPHDHYLPAPVLYISIEPLEAVDRSLLLGPLPTLHTNITYNNPAAKPCQHQLDLRLTVSRPSPQSELTSYLQSRLHVDSRIDIHTDSCPAKQIDRFEQRAEIDVDSRGEK